jgi:hypothetical protein
MTPVENESLAEENVPVTEERARRSRLRRTTSTLILLLLIWLLVAYLLLPVAWRRYARRHPALEDLPGITYTANGVPGDPLNVALVGTEGQVAAAMLAAKWYPADPITLRSSLRIATATVFHRQYDDAPVSSLYLWGRKEDLAFEQPVGDDPKQRHHVRFWKADKTDDEGRPLWVGSATFDIRVGFSHTTGQITHHISADIDAERDHVIDSLEAAGAISETYWVDDFHKNHDGRNGGGDPYHTDGRLEVGVISLSEPAVQKHPAKDAVIKLKKIEEDTQ